MKANDHCGKPGNKASMSQKKSELGVKGWNAFENTAG
jgi:hypothetical protein